MIKMFLTERYSCLQSCKEREKKKVHGRSFFSSIRKPGFLLCSRLNRLANLGAAERNDYIFSDVYEDHETALNEHVA